MGLKISLQHKLFVEDPYKAFGIRHNVLPKLWHEMYNKRYLWHRYEIPVLAEYFNLKTGKRLHERTIRRWIKRTDLYTKGQRAIKQGIREVTPSYFEGTVTLVELEELLK